MPDTNMPDETTDSDASEIFNAGLQDIASGWFNCSTNNTLVHPRMMFRLCSDISCEVYVADMRVSNSAPSQIWCYLGRHPEVDGIEEYDDMRFESIEEVKTWLREVTKLLTGYISENDQIEDMLNGEVRLEQR